MQRQARQDERTLILFVWKTVQELRLRRSKLEQVRMRIACGQPRHRLRFSQAAAMLLIITAGWAGYAAQSTFPSVTADALDKQKVTVPAGLEGELNLLLLSFAEDQGNQLESWRATAQSLQHTNTSFRAYRMPIEERENVIFRWWANASLRSTETDPELWHWVVPLYVDKQPFKAQLGIADENSIVALLVDRKGRVLWRATGASSTESRAALIAAAQSAH